MYNPFSSFPQQNAMNPYQAYPQYQRPQFPVQKIGVIRVNGRAGADALQMAPNDQALLLDETAPLVWLAQTDGAGYKTLAPYKIEPYQPEAPVDAKSLEARVKRLEEMLNGKPDPASNGSGTGTDAAASAPTA